MAAYFCMEFAGRMKYKRKGIVSSMKDASFSVRIPAALLQRIKEHCAKEGLSQAQWFDRVATAVLDQPEVLPDPLQQRIEAVIAPFADRLEALEGKLAA